MGITSKRLMDLKLIDEIVPEPVVSAHRDRKAMAETLKTVLKRNLDELLTHPIDELVERRYQRLMQYGAFEESAA